MEAKRVRFEAQVLPHLDAMYRFAVGLTRSPDDAQDIVQEAILRAFRAFESFRGEEPKPWLLTIVRNCFLTARADHRRHVSVPILDDDVGDSTPVPIAPFTDPEIATIRADHERLLGNLLSKLSVEHREVLILRDVEDLSYREIATVANLAIGTVMSRLARARVALKELWCADHGDPTT